MRLYDMLGYFQIVDAVVIFSSFAIDIVFLGGVTGEEGQKAVAVLVVLLLWRIARVVDGQYAYFSIKHSLRVNYCTVQMLIHAYSACTAEQGPSQ